MHKRSIWSIDERRKGLRTRQMQAKSGFHPISAIRPAISSSSNAITVSETAKPTAMQRDESLCADSGDVDRACERLPDRYIRNGLKRPRNAARCSIETRRDARIVE